MSTKKVPLVSIVVVNYHQEQLTCDLLDSLRRISYPAYETIVVDNDSEVSHEDRYLRHHPELRVLNSPVNLGFAGGTNLGIREAKGDYLLLLNNDTLVPPGFLEPLVAALEQNPGVGMASPKIYFHQPEGHIQYAGATGIHPITGRGKKRGFREFDQGLFDEDGPTAFCNGACMLVRRQVIEEIGLLPELYFMYYEEHDFCERARRRGWGCYYVGRSHIVHRQSASMGRNNPLKTYYLFRNRWLYMRRLGQRPSYFLFLLYFLLLGVPLHLLRYLFRRQFRHALGIVRSIIWNISHSKTQHHEALN